MWILWNWEKNSHCFIIQDAWQKHKGAHQLRPRGEMISCCDFCCIWFWLWVSSTKRQREYTHLCVTDHILSQIKPLSAPFLILYLTVKLARLVSDENNVTEFLTYTAGAKCGFRCEKEYVVTNVLWTEGTQKIWTKWQEYLRRLTSNVLWTEGIQKI